MIKADLHIHTTASDGQYSPSEVVKAAKLSGIQCIAITDHDTIDGVAEGTATGTENGIIVLRGIELGASEHRSLHILGLGLAEHSPDLEKLCRKLRDSREERKYRILSYLKSKGVKLNLLDVERAAKGKVIARPHFATVMLENGYVSTIREAFDKYLDIPEFQTIERFKASAEECITTIHQAKGKAVLAHPCQLCYSTSELEGCIRRLKEFGLDSLECYYSHHTQAQTKEYIRACVHRRFKSVAA